MAAAHQGHLSTVKLLVSQGLENHRPSPMCDRRSSAQGRDAGET